ncbi:hypothetical protein DPMN_123324 [Dreissena polymorpha]|uniref:AMP-dependent synthetase/ligase domain-containing protein n=1 Tax=Dreissena polymorpha TaxID=45954 RepID=A0A9D4GR36_DREPO|nr:hypothetical protein DPMN_123324 [Dreissena polymorpha]
MRITVSGKEVKRVFDIIEAERYDVVYLPGYLLRDVCSRPDLSDKLIFVKSFVLSGERISRSAETELQNIAPTASLHSYYGTTETGGTASYTMTDPSQWEDGIIGMDPFISTCKINCYTNLVRH